MGTEILSQISEDTGLNMVVIQIAIVYLGMVL